MLISDSRVYRRRFYVLFVFCFLAFNQSTFWLTYSPISQSSQQYYNISESTVNLLLNWGPIIFLPCLPLSYILLNKRSGLKKTVVLLAIVDFIGMLIRVLPTLLNLQSSLTLLFVHLGQILNAACGPLVMSPVTQLSCLWFKPDERTRATTIALMSPSLGATMGFLVSPWLVTKGDDVPQLLYFHLILSIIALVMVLIYYPEYPPEAPSSTAQLLIDNSMNAEHQNTLSKYVDDVRRCFQTNSFVELCLVGGILGGVFAAWTGLFANILSDENFSEQQSGWFGFICTFCAIIGGLVTSTLADTVSFRRSFRLIIIVMLVGCFISVFAFNLFVKTIFSDKSLFESNVMTIGLCVTFAGFFQGSALPIVYESLAELMFPLPESLSASVLVQLSNLTALFVLLIPPYFYRFINFFVLISIGFCLLLMFFVNIDYKRRNEDERKQ